MKKILLFLSFVGLAFAGDLKVVTTKRPTYLGGGSTGVAKTTTGQPAAKITTVERPKYLGGGTVIKVQEPTKTTTIISVAKPKNLGGGESSIVKRK